MLFSRWAGLGSVSGKIGLSVWHAWKSGAPYFSRLGLIFKIWLFLLVVICISIAQSQNHDVHHRLPESNYGQYTMLWDHAFGSYRPYKEHYGNEPGGAEAAAADGAGKAKAA